MHILLALLILNPHNQLSERKLEGVFRSSGEAANASAHAAWGVAIPLAGFVVAKKPGLYVAGAAWVSYSLVNEFALHIPESSRERNLNLGFRLAPCILTVVVVAVLAPSVEPMREAARHLQILPTAEDKYRGLTTTVTLLW